MARSVKTLQLSEDIGGLRLVVETDDHRIEDVLDLPSASKLFLQFAAALNAAGTKADIAQGRTEPSFIGLEPNASMAGTMPDGGIVMGLQFPNFPTLRFHLDDARAAKVVAALNEILTAPADARKQGMN